MPEAEGIAVETPVTAPRGSGLIRLLQLYRCLQQPDQQPGAEGDRHGPRCPGQRGRAADHGLRRYRRAARHRRGAAHRPVRTAAHARPRAGHRHNGHVPFRPGPNIRHTHGLPRPHRRWRSGPPTGRLLRHRRLLSLPGTGPGHGVDHLGEHGIDGSGHPGGGLAGGGVLLADHVRVPGGTGAARLPAHRQAIPARGSAGEPRL